MSLSGQLFCSPELSNCLFSGLFHQYARLPSQATGTHSPCIPACQILLLTTALPPFFVSTLHNLVHTSNPTALELFTNNTCTFLKNLCVLDRNRIKMTSLSSLVKDPKSQMASLKSCLRQLLLALKWNPGRLILTPTNRASVPSYESNGDN